MTYPKDFINKIVCKDCFEVMKEIPDDSVDLLIADISYGILEAEYDFLDKEYKGPSYLINYLYNQSILILKDGCLGFIWFSILFFRKGNKNKKGIGGKDYFLTNNANTSDTNLNIYDKVSGSKNLNAIKYLVRIGSNENGIVLDLFLGLGTSVVVCKQLGRRFIGIEFNSKYCKIAEERLKMTRRDNKQLTIK